LTIFRACVPEEFRIQKSESKRKALKSVILNPDSWILGMESLHDKVELVIAAIKKKAGLDYPRPALFVSPSE
jgi:hypothetical protein